MEKERGEDGARGEQREIERGEAEGEKGGGEKAEGRGGGYIMKTSQ